VVICFVASTLYSEYGESELGDAARYIATDSMPSVELLAAARAGLRHSELLFRQYASSPTPAVREEIQRERRVIARSVGDYLALPAEPVEREHFGALHETLSKFDEQLGAGLALADSGRPAAALTGLEAELQGDVVAAAEQLDALIRINAALSQRLASQISYLRTHSLHVALGLDGLSALLTAVTAILAWRAVRSYGRALEENNRLTSERAEELEQFAGRVAHDILGPLSAAQMFLSSGGQRTAEEATRVMCERSKRSIARVASIVNGLLGFARAGARPEPGVRTLVAPVVKDVLDELGPVAAQQSIELRVAPVAHLSVPCSEGIFASLLENLVRNAIKYMGGARPDVERRISVRILEAGGRVRCEVEDTGPGLSPELQRRLFEPYVRGRDHLQPGIGLGLATVKRVAVAHHGAVGVSSTPGSGSRFWFELPKLAGLDESAEPGSEGVPSLT
jgi:signal transduction histidine kinase